MLEFIPSEDRTTIAIEFSGKATKEDVDKFDQYVQQHFGTDHQFNVFVVIRNMDGSSLKGAYEGMKEDRKRWKQYKKVAMISEKNWVEATMKLTNYLPGISAKYFDQNQIEEAWNWMKQ